MQINYQLDEIDAINGAWFSVMALVSDHVEFGHALSRYVIDELAATAEENGEAASLIERRLAVIQRFTDGIYNGNNKIEPKRLMVREPLALAFIKGCKFSTHPSIKMDKDALEQTQTAVNQASQAQRNAFTRTMLIADAKRKALKHG